MLIVFNRERLVFDARDLLEGYTCSIINLPISVEIKYFDGVAPCGLALEIKQEEYTKIKEILIDSGFQIDHVFEVDVNDKEYKRVKA